MPGARPSGRGSASPVDDICFCGTFTIASDGDAAATAAAPVAATAADLVLLFSKQG